MIGPRIGYTGLNSSFIVLLAIQTFDYRVVTKTLAIATKFQRKIRGRTNRQNGSNS